MTRQKPLRQLTLEEARRDADHGIEQASSATGLPWIEYAKAYFATYCLEHPDVFPPALWEHGLVEPRSPRAYGAVVRHARTHGWIAPYPISYRPSPLSNGTQSPVYASRLYDPTEPVTYPHYPHADEPKLSLREARSIVRAWLDHPSRFRDLPDSVVLALDRLLR